MNRKNLMLMMAGAMAATLGNPQKGVYAIPKTDKTEFPNYIPPDPHRLYEFSIHGHKVMAYSKKDAIKRLKHQNKI
ncbi:MAG: hypothetical protein HDQ88_09855 [Clostridia bacterium]|nr:hypothetical protein [Clostridia bacterium]